MIEIVPMAEEHIDGVVTLEEATFSIPWTRADFEREVRENTISAQMARWRGERRAVRAAV